MEIGKVVFGSNRIEIKLDHYFAFNKNPIPLSLKDLIEMFGLDTDVSGFPPMSDIDTLHRRNATAIKRRISSCN